MTTGQRSGFDPPETLHLEVGRLGGRMDAMESRMDRHERTTSETLGRMEAKLDGIQDTLAAKAGVDLGQNRVVRVLAWAVGMVLTALGTLHLWGGGQH